MGHRRTAIKEAALPLKREDVLALSTRLNDPDWLREARLAAWDVAESLPMPTTSDEPWRRTDLRAMHLAEAASFVDVPGQIEQVPAELYRPLIGEEQGGLLIFSNGKLVRAELNPAIAAQGVIYTDLATAAREHPDLVRKHLMQQAVRAEEGKFAALHAALWTHGIFLYIPRGQHIELPFHSVEYVEGQVSTSTHILAVLEENASATYLHESASSGGADHLLHLGAIELLVGPACNLKFARMQNWAENVASFEHQAGRIRRGGQLDWVAAEMGTRLTKAFTTLELDEDEAWGRISGLYFTHGEQHLDLDTQQNHHALHNTSDLLYKGALRGRSRCVWQGMIVVDEGAQKTDGYQVNRNIILDGDARADSIPGLEIKADDVRCTHAAATGEMEEDEIFYLMARGVPRREAERVVLHGFYEDVIQRIPFEEVQQRIAALIDAKFDAPL